MTDSTADVEIIKKAEGSILGIIDDINRAMENGSLIGSVILTACALDVVAVLRAGGKKESSTNLFNRFIKEYMPEYHDLNMDLYGRLRSDLVHFYSATEFIYTDSERHPEIENLSLMGDKHCIVVDVFVEDASKAIFRYLEDLKNVDCKPEVLQNLIEAIGNKPLLGPLEYDELEGAWLKRASFSTIPVTGSERFPPVTGGP